MDQICLTARGSFSAERIVGLSLSDTQVVLFESAGFGAYPDDDSGDGGRSLLPADLPSTPAATGTYYLAVARFSHDPPSVGGNIFPEEVPAGKQGLTGPGGGSPITGWGGGSIAGGTHEIVLTRAVFY